MALSLSLSHFAETGESGMKKNYDADQMST
jgi:hypothetical protein